MCTRVVWPDANGSVIVGRNMDFHMDLLTNLWKLPRGMKRNDGVHGKLEWESKYGSVVAMAFDLVAVDGMNEKGFAGHILWLAESQYGEIDQSETQLSQAVWLQYYLDNFATVAEAVEWTEKNDVRIVQIPDPTGKSTPTLHLALNDKSGDSAIIEYIDGKAKVYHSRDYKVMTNSPTFDQQLELVKQYEGLGGEKTIPGGTEAAQRFARATYYESRLTKPKTQLDAIAAMFSVIRNAAQPFREPDPGKPDASQTIWQVVLDLTNLRYVFESTTRPNIVWVDFDKLSFKKGTKELKLDLVGRLSLEGGLAGDCSHKFTDAGEFVNFALDTGRTFIEVATTAYHEIEKLKAEIDAERRSRAADGVKSREAEAA